MGAIAFVGDRNAPGKRDWSGAFLPEATKFAAFYGGTVVRIPLDATKAWQRDAMITALRKAKIGYDPVVGIFCHGFTRRIELGFDLTTVGSLARELAKVGAMDVGLYTCSTGAGKGPGGDGGFADGLRDALCAEKAVECRVVAHVTPGHATMNPHKRFFHGLGSTVGGVGGVDVLTPTSKHWRAWRARLRDPKDTLRYLLPRLDFAQILEEVAS
jgi:hypothetical protein